VASRFRDVNPVIWQYSMHNWGSAEMHLGNVAGAIDIHRQLLALAEQEGNARLKVGSLHALGLDLHAQGDLAAARQHLTQALAIYREIGHTAKEAEVDHFLHRLKESA
jgi:tetratricopeptide (TPR) repeat protein